MYQFNRIAVQSARIFAALSLFVALAGAARLLGVSSGPQNPIDILGPGPFAWQTAFVLGYLFAAVGIWIESSWGSVVLLGAAGFEVLLAMLGDPAVVLNAAGFTMRLVLVLGALALIVHARIKSTFTVHD